MFIELAEALDCPSCREGAGLVAFVSVADERRVVRGHLGCPVCEIEFPILAGAIRFDRPAGNHSGDGPATPGAEDGSATPGAEHGSEGPPDLAVRLAALLGVAERPVSVILLGPPLDRVAADVARLGERVEVLAWAGAGEDAPAAWAESDLKLGVNPILAPADAPWPVRASCLHGVALRGGDPTAISEAGRALRPEGRLVLLEPTAPALDAAADGEIVELARDADTWVGRKA